MGALPCLAEAAEDLRSSPFRGMRVFSRSMAWSSHTQACIFLHKKTSIRKNLYFKTTNITKKLILKKLTVLSTSGIKRGCNGGGLGERPPKRNPKRVTGHVVFIIPF